MPNTFVSDFGMNYRNSVVLLDSRPVFLQQVTGLGDVLYKDVETGDSHTVERASYDTFQPLARLGFVNITGWAVWLARHPFRRGKIGICSENIRAEAIGMRRNANNPFYETATSNVLSLQCTELAESLRGLYPSFEAACQSIAVSARKGGSVAFDKQFAIGTDWSVFYRTKKVGVVGGSRDSLACIAWNEGFESLGKLIGDLYVSQRTG